MNNYSTKNSNTQGLKNLQSLGQTHYLRSRVTSRGPTYVEKGTTTRRPVQWVPHDECEIDRLRVQSWINLMKQD